MISIPPIIDELEELGEEIEKLQGLTTSCDQRNQREKEKCRVQFEELRKKIEKITGEKKSLEEEIILNNRSVDENRKNIMELNADNANLRKTINELQQSFNLGENMYNEKMQELSGLETNKIRVNYELNNVNQNTLEIKNKYKQLEANLLQEKKRLEKSIDVLNEKGNENLQNQTQIKQQIQTNEAEIKKLKEENERNKEENKLLKKLLQEKSSELEKARATLSDCNTKKDKLNAKIKEQEKTIELFEKIINDAVIIIRNMKVKIKNSLQSKI